MTSAELLALTDAMRSRGVRSFECEGLKVEFTAPEPTFAPSKAEKPVDDKCRCGHHKDDEHLNGLCIRGCDPTTCSPEPEKP